MQYLITALEGVSSFISPCMLPLLPVYLSYFAGEKKQKGQTFLRALFFVFGFSAVFSLLGLFAGSLGALLSRYQTAVNIVSGLVVVVFGLSYLDVIRLPFFKGQSKGKKVGSVAGAFLFGMIYSVSLTPCVGAFLGSALMLAANSGTAVQGVMLLLTYAGGLGIPFLLCAVLLDKFKSTFSKIKKHYKVINRVCGSFLILVGICMCFGWMNALMAVFS